MGICWQLFLVKIKTCAPKLAGCEFCDLFLQRCVLTRRGISTEELLLHVRLSRFQSDLDLEFKKE